jgi:hypothetical protein
MTDASELVGALRSIAAAFEALGVPWAIGGSVASGAYGEPRMTNDVDVIALLDVAAARKLGGLLGEDFYVDPDVAVEAVRARGSFNVIDTRSLLKIDVFVPSPGPLGEGQLSRRRTLQILPGLRPLPVLGPEDVVLQKLRWYQLGGETSDRQWRDLVAVLAQNRATLDVAYLHQVAVGALAPLLERALRDAASI